MAAKSKGGPRSRGKSPAAPPRDKTPAKTSPRQSGGKAPQSDSERAFVEGLINRGEAVEAEPNKALPAGATHEVVGRDKAGQPIVVRRRFSLK